MQFDPVSVLKSVSTELRYDLPSLTVEWNEKVDPPISCKVSSVDNRMVFTVYVDDAAGWKTVAREVEQSLLAGKFFADFAITEQMVLAAAKTCDLLDLTPYLTVVSRRGWALPTEGQSYELPSGVVSICDLPGRQESRLAAYLQDPLSALRNIHGDHLMAVMAVIIEQCSLNVDELVGAIIGSVGGWRSFTGSPITAKTPEGFVVVPTTQFALDYMENLLDRFIEAEKLGQDEVAFIGE
jgi:hypothetical protein